MATLKLGYMHVCYMYKLSADDITIKTVCTKMTDKDIKQEVYLNFVSIASLAKS